MDDRYTVDFSTRGVLKVSNVKAYNAVTGEYDLGPERTDSFPMWHVRFVITQDRKLFLINHYQTDAKLKKGSKIHFYLNDLYLVKGSIDNIKEEHLKGAPICRVYGLYWSGKEQGTIGVPQYWFEVDVVEPSLADAMRFLNSVYTGALSDRQIEKEHVSEASDKVEHKPTSEAKKSTVIDLADQDSWQYVLNNLSAINVGRKVQDFIHACIRKNSDILISTPELRALLNSVIKASDESDEYTLKFIRTFERLGFKFQYDSDHGWNIVESSSPKLEVPTVIP